MTNYTFELKNVSYNARLSEETNAFSADLWVNGKKAGGAQNRGHGGPTDVYLNLLSIEERAAVNAWVEAQPPTVISAEITGGEPYSMKTTLETIVDGLLQNFLVEKEEKKWIKKEIVFRLKGDAADTFRNLRSKEKPFVYRKALRQILITKYGEKIEVILNDKYGQAVVE